VQDGTRKGAVLIAREAQGGEEEKPAIGMKSIFASTYMTVVQGLKIQREGPWGFANYVWGGYVRVVKIL
jgi:hypothetical protein